MYVSYIHIVLIINLKLLQATLEQHQIVVFEKQSLFRSFAMCGKSMTEGPGLAPTRHTYEFLGICLQNVT